jgi:hypothetical protein
LNLARSHTAQRAERSRVIPQKGAEQGHFC